MGEQSPEENVPQHRVTGEARGFVINSDLYDKLKWFALVVLPAFGAAYFSLGDLWDLPKGTEVVGTCTIVGTFLGVVLGISNQRYKKDPARFSGKVIYQDSGGKVPDVNLVLDKSPQDFQGKKEVTFKVIDETR